MGTVFEATIEREDMNVRNFIGTVVEATIERHSIDYWI